MNERELRGLVRAAIAREAGVLADEQAQPSMTVVARHHASHGVFALAGADSDGRCMIEPAVMCEHCGYCTSYGH